MTGVNPYKGLRAFQEADAGEFCGRDALVAELVERVDGHRRSSRWWARRGRARAPWCTPGWSPSSAAAAPWWCRWCPATDPLVELEAALRRVATVDDEATIAARLRTPGGLTAIARDLAAPGEQLVVVVDQFEELWTLIADAAVRDRFAELLAHAADTHAAGPEDGLRVVAPSAPTSSTCPCSTPRWARW